MASDAPRRARDARPRRAGRPGVTSRWGALAWAVAGALVIGAARAPLAEAYHESPRHDDVSLLLSPQYTLLFSLGHREALADYLFATLLVQYGISFGDRRAFTPSFRYLDTITTLAPSFDRPYLFADTLLTMLPTPAGDAAYEQVLELQGRGLRAMPFHAELWSVAGQFAAYLAPPRLSSAKRREELRLVGAERLARACELAGGNENIPYHCITAARLLNKAGERDAMMRMLVRTLSVQDDPKIRELVEGYMQHVDGVLDRDRNRRRLQALEREWKAKFPHASRNMVSLLGPSSDVWHCSGPGASVEPSCSTSWATWNELRSADARP